jgi:hypothetical protein
MIEYKVKVNGGHKAWYLNDELHREDGPACERANGSKAWYINNELHREDGPACEWANGSKEWYINGRLHREDGPAIIYTDGGKSWYLNGESLTEEEFNNRTQTKELTIEEIEAKLGYKIKVVRE